MIGVASLARAIGRAAPTSRMPTVLNAAAGVVNDRPFAVRMLTLAVIEPKPETRETALLGATVAIAGGGLLGGLLMQICPAPQHAGVPSLSLK
jgi:hypothetical protein